MLDKGLFIPHNIGLDALGKIKNRIGKLFIKNILKCIRIISKFFARYQLNREACCPQAFQKDVSFCFV